MTRQQYFIYPRDKHGHRTGHTIAVIIRDYKIFHGTALCSKEDHFSKEEGRKIALERAEEAFHNYQERCKEYYGCND